MFCKYCGQAIANDSVYCRFCGKPQSQSVNPTVESEISKVVPIREEERSYDTLKNENDFFFSHKVKKYKVIGCVIILLFVIGGILSYYEVADMAAFYTGSFIFVIIRIFLAYRISTSVKEVNRNSIVWWFFTFLFPGLSLIVYSNLTKKLLPVGFSNYSDNGKAEFLGKYAYRLAKEVGEFRKATSMIEKALEFDKEYYPGYDIRAYIKYYLKDYESAIKDSNIAIENDNDNPLYLFHRGHILYKLADEPGACSDWKRAAEMGNKLAAELLKSHCT